MALVFLSAAETAARLRADADGFAAGLSPANLAARGQPSAAAYRAAAAAAARDFPPALRARLAAAWGAALARLAARGDALGAWVAACLARRVGPPRLALVEGAAVEGGLPHTRGGRGRAELCLEGAHGTFVVLPTAWLAARPAAELPATLLHEAAHLAQRADPAGAARLLRARGFRRAAPWGAPGLADLRATLRANPDEDGWVWRGPAGAPLAGWLRPPPPGGRWDLHRHAPASPAVHHPYEVMAYALGEGRPF